MYKIDKFVVIFFLLLHVVFFLNYGYTGSKRFATAAKVFSSIQLLVMVVLFWVFVFPLLGRVWSVWIIIGWWQWTMNAAILSFFSHRYSFYRMLKDFNDMDIFLGNGAGCCVNIKMICFTLGIILCRYGYDLFLCHIEVFQCSAVRPAQFIRFNYLCFNATMMVCFFFFYSAYFRLKILNDLIGNRCLHVFECLKLYKTINDIVDNIMKMFQYLYVVALIQKIMDWLMLIYSIMRLISVDIEMSFRLVVTVINAFLSLIVGFLPVISLCLLKSEGEALKLNIHERLLQERGGELEHQLEMFAEYVAARPTRFQLLRIFDLDWTLPLKTIHLCVTYQIIIVQFTHLF